jgi:hypothetical protein
MEFFPQWHFKAFILTCILTFYLNIYSDILNAILSGILSDIYSGILSGILSDLTFLLAFSLTFSSDILFWHSLLAFSLWEHSDPELAVREHCDLVLAVEVRRGTL